MLGAISIPSAGQARSQGNFVIPRTSSLRLPCMRFQSPRFTRSSSRASATCFAMTQVVVNQGKFHILGLPSGDYYVLVTWQPAVIATSASPDRRLRRSFWWRLHAGGPVRPSGNMHGPLLDSSHGPRKPDHLWNRGLRLVRATWNVSEPTDRSFRPGHAPSRATCVPICCRDCQVLRPTVDGRCLHRDSLPCEPSLCINRLKARWRRVRLLHRDSRLKH